MNAILDGLHWFTRHGQWSGADGIPHRLLEHLTYSGLALAITVLIALPLGLLLGHAGGGWAATLVAGANSARALPTLGLLTLMVTLTDSNLVPILIPLVLLAIPPVLANAYTGIQQVEPQLRDAAEGMGMTGRQVLVRVEIPVALPLVLLGLRTASIQIVSTAAIAAFVGLGGLGRYIIDGLKRQEYATTAGGAILVIVLAFGVQAVFAVLYRAAVSPGLRQAVRP